MCDWAGLSSGSTCTPGFFSLTPRFSGVYDRPFNRNRFSGFGLAIKTAKAVRVLNHRTITPLKRGVNETSSAIATLNGVALRGLPAATNRKSKI